MKTQLVLLLAYTVIDLKSTRKERFGIEVRLRSFRKKLFYLGYTFEIFRFMVLVVGKRNPKTREVGRDHTPRNRL